MHVFIQDAFLEENQEIQVHKGIIFGGKKKKSIRRPKGEHSGNKLESFSHVGHTSKIIRINWNRASPSLYPILPVILLSTLLWALGCTVQVVG